jgi:xanthine dehydrogenase accessory factor
MLTILNKIRELLENNQVCLLVTATKGSRLGAAALFQENGRHLAGQLLPLPQEDGVHLIQEQTLFRETLRPAPVMIICGGGHIAVPLAKMAQICDFQVTVLEDRADFLTRERFPQGELIVDQDLDKALTELNLGSQHYVVIVTRGHVHDRICLVAALKTKAAYIGMIGSKKKVIEVKAWLQEQGFSKEDQERAFAPVGIPIGDETPAEIAVSILAQAIEVRSKQPATPEIGEILEALSQKPSAETWALATIVKADGSTPRGVGARMLVTKNGAISGTVGGGIGEEEVRMAALDVIADQKPRLMDFKLNSTVAANQGMVCGGNFSVFIQPI